MSLWLLLHVHTWLVSVKYPAREEARSLARPEERNLCRSYWILVQFVTPKSTLEIVIV